MTLTFDPKSLKAHLPSILALGVAIWAHYGTTVTAYILAHPKLSGWFGFGSFIVAYYLKSPIAPKPEPPKPAVP